MSAKKKRSQVGRKLNDYDPMYANAKVSVAAMWKHIATLETLADDPAKVKKWGEKLWRELDVCQIV
jgi:hypothetical protein